MGEHTVLNVDEVAAGSTKAVVVGGKNLLICHAQDDKWYAIDDTCTHDGGPLASGTLDNKEIECPRHGARFDVTTGKVTCLPAAVGIKSYPVKITNSKVTVDIS